LKNVLTVGEQLINNHHKRGLLLRNKFASAPNKIEISELPIENMELKIQNKFFCISKMKFQSNWQ